MIRTLFILLLAILALPLQAQNPSAQRVSGLGSRGPVTRPATLDVDPELFDSSRLIVKFVEGRRVRLRDGQLVEFGEIGAKSRLLEATMAALQGARIERLFTRSEEDLDRERERILLGLPEGFDAPADLNNYYLVQVETAASGRALWARLLERSELETVFADHRVGTTGEPGDLPPTTPDFEARQSFWGEAPQGVGIRHAHQLDGGRGEELQVLDIELGLVLNHEDVPRAIAANVIGTMTLQRDHGLAVAGLLVAQHNGYGVQGGVYRAGFKFHSHESRNWASSVSVATANSRSGDVIVLEVQLAHPVTRRYVPMEHRQDVFDAVRSATLQGIHVFAAAGNGSADLDDPAYQGIFDRSVRDSGAVLVGATDGASLQRASFSNFGSIVDVNGQGLNVTSTGYTDLFHPGSDPRQRYTSQFSGTSSATPIATSAGAAVLSAAKRQLRRVLSPLELRDLLRKHGTPVPGGKIGLRPDCKQLLAALGLPQGLGLRGLRSFAGQTMTLELEGPANGVWVLYASLGRASLPTPNGRFLLDPAWMWFAGAGFLDAAGFAQFTTQVPAQKNVLWAELYWQAFRLGAHGTELSGSVVTMIER
jgi:serine protease